MNSECYHRYPKSVVTKRNIINIGGVDVVRCLDTDREIYYYRLNQVVENLARANGGYKGWWIVGGWGRDAVQGKQNPTVMSPTGEWRDVDVLTSKTSARPIAEAIGKMQYEIPVHISGKEVEVDIESSESQLIYGGIQIPVSSRVFETRIAQIGGVVVPTLPPETLLHLYCTGYRPKRRMRRKDFINALDLARYIRQSSTRIDHALFDEFHEFAHRRGSQFNLKPAHALYTLAVLYRESRMNNVLPITSNRIRPFLNFGWETICHISHLTGSSR